MAAINSINAKGEAAPQPVKVQRYWPGKAPINVKDYYSSEEEEEKEEEEEQQKQQQLFEFVNAINSNNNNINRSRGSNNDNNINRRRRHYDDISTSNTITSTKTVAGDARQINGHDEEDLEVRRVRIKQKALEKRRQEEERLKALEDAEKAKEIIFKDKNEEEEEVSESEEEEEETSSEYETDSEDEQSSRKLLKPIFIPKAHRESILEKERKEKEAKEAELKRLQELEERKKESHAMLAEQIQRELQKESVEKATTIEDVDDTDGLDEQAEYEAWKLRELKRIKRDKEERESREREKREIEERRNMNEKQRLKEDLELVKKQREEKSKGHYKFLQKYYHKGAFYLNNEDEIFKRDYTEATPDEAAHKELLPKVMQVKNFGRAGQTKWTHLADQDTSKKDSAWTQKSDVNKRTATKLGGLHGGFEKPTSKKRKT